MTDFSLQGDDFAAHHRALVDGGPGKAWRALFGSDFRTVDQANAVNEPENTVAAALDITFAGLKIVHRDEFLLFRQLGLLSQAVDELADQVDAEQGADLVAALNDLKGSSLYVGDDDGAAFGHGPTIPLYERLAEEAKKANDNEPSQLLATLENLEAVLVAFLARLRQLEGDLDHLGGVIAELRQTEAVVPPTAAAALDAHEDVVSGLIAALRDVIGDDGADHVAIPDEVANVVAPDEEPDAIPAQAQLDLDIEASDDESADSGPYKLTFSIRPRHGADDDHQESMEWPESSDDDDDDDDDGYWAMELLPDSGDDEPSPQLLASKEDPADDTVATVDD